MSASATLRDHQPARRVLLDRLLDTQARLAANLGPGVHRRTRAALLRRIGADLTAVFTVLAAGRLPGRTGLARSVEAADALLVAAGVWDDGMVMPRCRAAVRQAARAALAEDTGRVAETASATALIELAIGHAATVRDIAAAIGNEVALDLADRRHEQALVALARVDFRPDPAAVPPLPSEASAAELTVQ